MNEAFPIQDNTKPEPEAILVPLDKEGLTAEQRAEILSNGIDIINTENIKYKMPHGLASFLVMAENGLLSGEAIADSTLEIGKKWKSVKNNPRVQKDNNVYFPQNSLSILKRRLAGGDEEQDELTEKERLTEVHQITAALKILNLIVKDREDKPGTTSEIEDTEYYGLSNYSNKIIDKANEDHIHLAVNDSSREWISTFLKKHSDEITRLWNKKFLSEVEDSRDPTKQHPQGGRGDTHTNLIGYQYGFDIAYIISPDVPTVSADYGTFGNDYPTEAVIDTMRIPPRKFKGIIINRKIFEGDYSNFSDFIPKDALTSVSYDNHERFLKKTPFKFPNAIPNILYGMQNIIEYAGYGLKKELMMEGNLTEKDILNAFNIYRDYITYGTQKDAFEAKYSAEEIDKAYKIGLDYAKKHTPIHDGEPIWRLLVETAKKLKVPIYNTAGQILWPEKVS